MFAINDPASDSQQLRANPIHRLRDGSVHIRRISLARQCVVVPVDDDFGNVAMVFFHTEDHVDLQSSIENRSDFVKVFAGMFFDCRSQSEISSGKFQFHPAAPFFRQSVGGC
jgi:uncharacterized protein YlaI